MCYYNTGDESCRRRDGSEECRYKLRERDTEDRLRLSTEMDTETKLTVETEN